LVNRTQPTVDQLARYRHDGAEFIHCQGHLPSAGGAELIETDLPDTNSHHVRHDSDKLAAVILGIAQRWRHPLYDQARPAGDLPKLAVPAAGPGSEVALRGAERAPG